MCSESMLSIMRPSADNPSSVERSSAFQRRSLASKAAVSLLLRASSGAKMRKLRAFWLSLSTSRTYLPSSAMSSATASPGAGTSTA